MNGRSRSNSVFIADKSFLRDGPPLRVYTIVQRRKISQEATRCCSCISAVSPLLISVTPFPGPIMFVASLHRGVFRKQPQTFFQCYQSLREGRTKRFVSKPSDDKKSIKEFSAPDFPNFPPNLPLCFFPGLSVKTLSPSL